MKTKKTNSRRQKSLPRRIKQYLRLVLVPQKANQYRPHLVRRYGLALVALLAILGPIAYVQAVRPSVLGARAALTGPALVADGNAARGNQGLAPLQSNAALTRAAYMKAQDMFAHQYWAHVSPSGVTPWQWFGKVGYDYTAAGENLAKNFTSAEATTAAWMASPEHRKNVLNPQYVDVGYAVVDGMLDGRATTLVVALYGQPAAKGVVAGVMASESAPPLRTLGPLTRFGVALQSLSPATLGALALVSLGIIVALAAHLHRDKLPKARRDSWYRHHGLAKAGGMTVLAVLVLFLSGGGQI